MKCVKPNIKSPQCRGIVAVQDDSLMKVGGDSSEEKFKPSGLGRGTNSCIPASIECIKVSPFETLTFDRHRDAWTQFQTALTRNTL